MRKILISVCVSFWMVLLGIMVGVLCVLLCFLGKYFVFTLGFVLFMLLTWGIYVGISNESDKVDSDKNIDIINDKN